ncbi:MAG: GTPase [Microcoleus sp. SIO2G3]|nr:GTPase [Microcoleus sp. SIO2G3]
MEIMRLIVTGAVDSGKSSLIRSVSEIQVADLKHQATTRTSSPNETTATALDYGRVNIGSDMAMHLYGTPGQAKFSYIWELLISRAHACLVVVAANRPGDFHYARLLLSLMEARMHIPMIIGLTHTDCPTAWSKEDVTIALGYAHQEKRPTMVTVNPTEKTSVLQVLKIFVEQYSSKESSAFRREKAIAA